MEAFRGAKKDIEDKKAASTIPTTRRFIGPKPCFILRNTPNSVAAARAEIIHKVCSCIFSPI
jgi:hypothetical protein